MQRDVSKERHVAQLSAHAQRRIRNPRDFIRIQTDDIHNMFHELRQTEHATDRKYFNNMPELLRQMNELADEQRKALSGFNYNVHIEDNPTIRKDIEEKRHQQTMDKLRKQQIREVEQAITQELKENTNTTQPFNQKLLSNDGFRGDGLQQDIEFVTTNGQTINIAETTDVPLFNDRSHLYQQLRQERKQFPMYITKSFRNNR